MFFAILNLLELCKQQYQKDYKFFYLYPLCCLGSLIFFGDFWTGLMYNGLCFRYLGCNIGFFGYDAVVHFFSGILEAIFLIWLCHKFPKTNILHEDSVWKNIVVLIAFVALLAVTWELLEFSADHFRMYILHENLTNPNILAQPNNSDTMGDFTFGLSGAFLGAFLVKYFDSKSIRKN